MKHIEIEKISDKILVTFTDGASIPLFLTPEDARALAGKLGTVIDGYAQSEQLELCKGSFLGEF